MTARRKDGTEVELMFNASPLRADDGRVIGVVVIATDISDLIATQELLEEAEGRYRTLVEQLPAVSYIAEPGAKGTWQYVSPQLERMLGFSQEEWTADPTLWARRIHPEDRDRVLEEEERDSILGVPLASEYRMITKDGRVIWVRDEGVLRAERGERVHYEGMLTNVTERKSFESQLQFLADHDPLTGLFNRRRFVQELDLEIKLMRRDGHPSSLLMLDVDGLKQVNDAMGHQAGDALVRQTAEVLRDRLRGTDSVGRLGGDEFAVLLRGSRVNEAAAVAQVLLDRFRGREQVASAEPIRPTISIGLTACAATSPAPMRRSGPPTGRCTRPSAPAATGWRCTRGGCLRAPRAAAPGPTRSATPSTRTGSCSTASRSSTSPAGRSTATRC